jgi:hypothetical protein
MVRAFIIVFVLIVVARPAYAYVDPGTGSMLAQLLLGGVMTAAVFFRSGVRRLREMLRADGRSSHHASE